MRALNELRAARKLPPIALRPHAGEAGATHHLASAFLFADGISHGINLAKSPVLQYLYYLARVGISVSPLSNKALFIDYAENPFASLFHRGLRVTLTTDDPLMFHLTPQPLLEEYAVARAVWRLSMTSMCEIAHNSVLIASLPPERKAALAVEDQEITNVPERRFDFRRHVLASNFAVLQSAAPKSPYWAAAG